MPSGPVSKHRNELPAKFNEAEAEAENANAITTSSTQRHYRDVDDVIEKTLGRARPSSDIEEKEPMHTLIRSWHGM